MNKFLLWCFFAQMWGFFFENMATGSMRLVKRLHGSAIAEADITLRTHCTLYMIPFYFAVALFLPLFPVFVNNNDFPWLFSIVRVIMYGFLGVVGEYHYGKFLHYRLGLLPWNFHDRDLGPYSSTRNMKWYCFAGWVFEKLFLYVYA